MARYDIYQTHQANLIIDVQANLLNELKTRVVVPVLPLDHAPLPAKRLNPIFIVNGSNYVMVTQFISAIPAAQLNDPIANVSSHHLLIVAALDMLFQGF